jgi:hypothetical protein
MMSGSWRRMDASRFSTWLRSFRLGMIVQQANPSAAHVRISSTRPAGENFHPRPVRTRSAGAMSRSANGSISSSSRMFTRL